MVVLISPVLDEDLCLEETVEAFEVQQFVSKLAVERLDVGVLPGSTGLDVGRRDAVKSTPVPKCRGGELGTVVTTDVSWGDFAFCDKVFEDPNGPVERRCCGR